MKEVLAIVAAVRRRLYVNLLLKHFFAAGFYTGAAFAAAFLAAKIIFFPGAYTLLAWAALALLVAAATWAAVAARMALFEASVEADEGLGLAERLSTALAVSRERDAMSKAVVLDARSHARRVKLEDRFPVRLPPRSWRLAAALLVITGVLVLPQFDPFGRQAAFKRREKEKAEVAKAVQDLKKKVEDLKSAFEGKEFAGAAELDALEMKLVDMDKAGLTKKDALAGLSEDFEKLAEKMNEAANDLAAANNDLAAKNQLAKALADQQKQLEQMKQQASDLQEQQDALEAAQQKLAELAKKAAEGEMSKEEAEAMAQALQELAKSMPEGSQLAQQMQQAADALQSGNQQQASQMAQQAAQQAQQASQQAGQSLTSLQSQMAALQSQMGLTQQQMAALQSQMQNMQNQGQQGMQLSSAEAQQQLQDMMQAMQGLKDFSSNMTGGESVSMAEALEQLQQAEARAGQGASGRLPGQGGNGPGMGGPGQGEGNVWDVAPESPDPMLKDNVPGEMKPGRVLASYMTPGGQIKNESIVEYHEMVLEGEQKAKEALSDQKVPRTYEKVVKDYFENLEKP